MVWWGVSCKGFTSLCFCEKWVKTGAKVYQEDVLEGVLKQLGSTLFNGERWIFQQDSAPVHNAKITQQWLKNNIPGFIAAADWASGSSDLDPLDCSLCSELEKMGCRRLRRNLRSLKQFLAQVAQTISMETERTVLAEWPNRLKACVKKC
ncbi:uncharacterized protein LOC128863773 [Anastrepha ludens]|uniref:uncharacterized protein LOC128863773 n=1 Tax=Anastrepha ludens TaxID=28586 RepID=UPI0023AFD1FF|nr:uncharacterized protein LOC128863773 [Anastrepha ludens]